MQCAFGCGII